MLVFVLHVLQDMVFCLVLVLVALLVLFVIHVVNMQQVAPDVITVMGFYQQVVVAPIHYVVNVGLE
jgi:energy-converting hydrogenase Eha subunit F